MASEGSIGLRRDRTQSKRAAAAVEQEKYLRGLTSNVLDGVSEPSDENDSDDETYGKTGAKGAKQRKKGGVLQLLKQQGLQPMQALTPSASSAADAPPELDDEFKPLQGLKGGNPTDVVGRRITVWYDDDEGAGEQQQPSHGVVAYYGDEGRMFVVFDEDDDSEGLWVDGRDEWDWADEKVVGPAPPPPPVPGCWRPSARTAEDAAAGEEQRCDKQGAEKAAAADDDDVVGDIDKVFLVRAAAPPTSEACAPRPSSSSSSNEAALELFVKWKGLAHVHSQWVPRGVLERSDVINKRKVVKFLNDVRSALPEGVDLAEALAAHSSAAAVASSAALAAAASSAAVVANAEGVLAGEGEAEAEAYNPAFTEVEKVLARRHGPGGGAPEWLVKWRGLPHAASTWESCLTMMGHQSAIGRWRVQSRTPPTAKELAVAAQVPFLPDPSRFRPLAASPVYRHGHTLRPHQLDGLNWLLFSWYQRRNVMLADESRLRAWQPSPRPARPAAADLSARATAASASEALCMYIYECKALLLFAPPPPPPLLPLLLSLNACAPTSPPTTCAQWDWARPRRPSSCSITSGPPRVSAGRFWWWRRSRRWLTGSARSRSGPSSLSSSTTAAASLARSCCNTSSTSTSLRASASSRPQTPPLGQRWWPRANCP